MRGGGVSAREGTAPLPSVNTSTCTEYSRVIIHFQRVSDEQSPILHPSSVSDFRHWTLACNQVFVRGAVSSMGFKIHARNCGIFDKGSTMVPSAHEVRGKWAFSRQAFAVVPASLGAPATRRSTRALSDDVLADNTRSTIGGGGRIQGADGGCSRVRTRALTL